MVFEASFDRTTKIISAVTFFLLLILVLLLHNLIAGCAAIFLLLSAYAYSPQSYVVSGDTLVVKRLIGDVSFPLAGVRAVRQATAADLEGSIRLWGSGGLFGYYGAFRTSHLGTCRWYVTNRRNTVVFLADSITLFSPNDVPGFLAAIRANSPASTPRAVVARSRVKVPHVGWLIAAASILPLAVLVPAFTYSPGAPRYTFAKNALTINDKFYPVTLHTSDIDTAHLSVVDLSRDRDWQPTARTNGFANSHYRSGWFKTANGKKIRLYQAAAKQLVLIPSRGTTPPVLLEVKDPATFIQQVTALAQN